ncbi:MAG: ABC transporter permease [Deltaproteobacteria bacterium]|nr:ABC transporter permease [Deltaproteobacteria bacterium]
MSLPISYSVRNVRARLRRTSLTIAVIALAVVASAVFLALISSLQRTLVSTGSPANLVVLRKGSDNDGSSMLTLEAYQAIRFFDGIARNAEGQPIVSPEMVVQPTVRAVSGTRENVLARGVEPMALVVHDRVRIVAGRMFRPSSGEAVLGAGTVGRYQGARLGEELAFGRRRWRVVGIMEAAGSSFESEVWVDARELASDANRPFPYSGIRLRVAAGADRDALVRRIEDDPRYALEAKPETDYYAEQAKSSRSLYVLLVVLAVPVGIAAGLGAANTMFAAVQARTVEIGTLRALGFSRATILRAFLLESFGVAMVGFAVGAVGTLALAAGIGAVLGDIGFTAATFTTNLVALRVGAGDLAAAFLFAAAIGIIGGLLPAWRAARLRPVEALRKA